MKKAVIAVAAVLVFIFTLTQKSEAVPATDWADLSGYLSNDIDYYTSSSIELTGDIASDSTFIALLTLGADKKITSNSGSSFSLTFSPPPNQAFWL